MASVFEVARVIPESEAAGSEELFLNQEVAVRFTRPIDPLSVTEDTVRMTDDRGQRVEGELRVSSHTVTFVPIAPVQATLDDGTFAPGRSYVLEVAGFPRGNALRATSGEVLARTLVRRFHTVAADAVPCALLHTEDSPFGFALDTSRLGMAAESRALRLYFHEPPLPTTVTSRAFRLYRARRAAASFEPEAFLPDMVKLRRIHRPYPHLPGWMIELSLAAVDVTEGEYLCVELVTDPANALRDCRGLLPKRVEISPDGSIRQGDVVGQPLLVRVYSGRRVPWVREDFGLRASFRAARPGALGFETRDGRVVPQVRHDAGTGELGTLAPTTDVEIVVGGVFVRGDGSVARIASGTLEFIDVRIPAGVTVTIRGGDQPIHLKSCGAIQIDGELRVLTTCPGNPVLRAEPSVIEILEASGAALLAGGELRVTGRLERPGQEGQAAHSLALVCGADLWLEGASVPPRTLLAIEPGARTFGEVQGGPIGVRVQPMDRRIPAGAVLKAEAATDWVPLPASARGALDVEILGREGDLDVLVQAAPPDASSPGRPDERAGLLRAPLLLPLSAPLQAAPGSFVRFYLRARVASGQSLPWLGGLAVVEG